MKSFFPPLSFFPLGWLVGLWLVVWAGVGVGLVGVGADFFGFFKLTCEALAAASLAWMMNPLNLTTFITILRLLLQG